MATLYKQHNYGEHDVWTPPQTVSMHIAHNALETFHDSVCWNVFWERSWLRLLERFWERSPCERFDYNIHSNVL